MAPQWSKHNLIAPVRGSGKYLLVNLLQGQADLLDKENAAPLLQKATPTDGAFAEKGYFIDPEVEASLFRRRYLDFLDARENEEVQVFFVPWYHCNFACTYCFQDEYDPVAPDLSDARLDAFFAHLEKNLAGRRKYLTLFGGEPLLGGEVQRAYIARFLKEARRRGLETAIVTNGYHLAEYREILRQGKIREVQVTLDGTAAAHDARRHLKGKGPTFDAIVKGIDMVMEEGWPVNLRMVVDKTNIAQMPELARFAIQKGWTKNPLFKTQLGRNYELHHCQASPEALFERAALYETIHDMAKRDPDILEFHRPAYSVAKFLSQEGRLPDPLFDACPGTKSEWAYDSAGRIFACTATVGKSDEVLGTYHPFETLDQATVTEWVSRDVTSIAACASCPSQLACGGGCAAVAKRKHGAWTAPDCRPIPALLSMGASLYFPEEVNHDPVDP